MKGKIKRDQKKAVILYPYTWEYLYQLLQFWRKIERGERHRHVVSNVIFDADILNCTLDYGKDLVW